MGVRHAPARRRSGGTGRGSSRSRRRARWRRSSRRRPPPASARPGGARAASVLPPAISASTSGGAEGGERRRGRGRASAGRTISPCDIGMPPASWARYSPKPICRISRLDLAEPALGVERRGPAGELAQALDVGRDPGQRRAPATGRPRARRSRSGRRCRAAPRAGRAPRPTQAGRRLRGGGGSAAAGREGAASRGRDAGGFGHRRPPRGRVCGAESIAAVACKPRDNRRGRQFGDARLLPLARGRGNFISVAGRLGLPAACGRNGGRMAGLEGFVAEYGDAGRRSARSAALAAGGFAKGVVGFALPLIGARASPARSCPTRWRWRC